MKPETFKSLLLGALLLGGSQHTLRAQSYSVDWFTIAGGAGAITNSQYTLSGTIGQPDDGGLMTGGGYSLTGGFWTIVSVVQTFPGPLLAITRSTTNTVVLSWPSPSTGFILQQNSTLIAANWVNAPQTPADNGTTKSVVVNPSAGALFFRLKQP